MTDRIPYEIPHVRTASGLRYRIGSCLRSCGCLCGFYVFSILDRKQCLPWFRYSSSSPIADHVLPNIDSGRQLSNAFLGLNCDF